MPTHLPILLAAALAAAALTACGPPPAIECPTAQMRGADGVLVESAADIAKVGNGFREGFGGNAIPEAIAAVRQAHPGATDDEIRNYLIAAYCPVARETVTGKADQQEKLDQFETALVANLSR